MLSPLSLGGNEELVDDLQICLQAAIVQFARTGTGLSSTTPPDLPARPEIPPSLRAPEPRVPIPPKPLAQVPKTTWATVT
ncbi:hypothetical protein K3495_g415 [Podosphaera aphanis]|nr:hypothetical protein K3495_g415 [Podosphaera aphanis]